MESSKESPKDSFNKGVARDILLAHLYLQEVREGFGDMPAITPEGEFAIPDVNTGITTIKGENKGVDGKYTST